jgi:putative heme degradation protein
MYEDKISMQKSERAGKITIYFATTLCVKNAELVEKLRNKAVKSLHGDVSKRLSTIKAIGKFVCVLSAAPEAVEQIARVVGERVSTEAAAGGWLSALRHKFHQVALGESILVEALPNSSLNI